MRTRDIFNGLLRRARTRVPGLAVTLHVGDVAEFRPARAHAYCTNEHGGLRIYVAPKLLAASRDRIDAILRHEFGHAVFFFHKEMDHTERDADKLAEALFGDVIRYDAADVQALAVGVARRPKHLG